MSFIKNDSAQSGLGIIFGIGCYLILVIIMWYLTISFLISWQANLIWKLLVMLIVGVITVSPGLILLKSRTANSK